MKWILTFIFLAASNAFAFTLVANPPIKFGVPEIVVNVAGNSCTNAGITVNTLLDLVEEAVDLHWNSVPTSAIQLKRGSITDADISASSSIAQVITQNNEEGSILIGCSSGFAAFSDGFTGALGGISSGPSGTKGGVAINNGALSQFSDLDHSEQVALLAHEVGHAVGLGHSGDPVALMYFSIGGKVQEKLTQDDHDGITYLYPHDSPGSCGTIDLNHGDSWKNGSKSLALGFLLAMIAGLMRRPGRRPIRLPRPI